MKDNRLVLVARNKETIFSRPSFNDTLTESLWDTTKNQALHIILREPALMELAKRRDPGVIAFCDSLLCSEDQECWFTALRALEALQTYEAAQRLLVLSGNSSTADRKIVMNVLARILSSSHREGFRRLLCSIVTPGELDVSGWTSTALRILETVCHDSGLIIEDTTKQIVAFDSSDQHAMQFGHYQQKKNRL